ncbi:hypothetical protein AAY473_036648, partial [Plecturocebus cupreus]
MTPCLLLRNLEACFVTDRASHREGNKDQIPTAQESEVTLLIIVKGLEEGQGHGQENAASGSYLAVIPHVPPLPCSRWLGCINQGCCQCTGQQGVNQRTRWSAVVQSRFTSILQWCNLHLPGS